MISSNKLFARDIYSYQRIEYTSVSNSLKKKISNSIFLNYFNFDQAKIKVQRIGGHGINSQNFRIRIKGKEYVAKIISICKNEKLQEVKQQLHIVDKVNALRKVLPISILNKQSNYLTTWAESSYLFLMKREKGQFYDGKLDTARDIITKMSDLYTELGKTSPQENNGIRRRSYFEKKYRNGFKTLKLLYGMRKLKIHHPVEKYLQHDFLIFEKNYNYCLKMWEQKNIGSSYRLCHIDLHPRNMLFSKRKLQIFLDTESLMLSSPITAIGYSIFKIFRSYTSLQKKGDRDQAIRIFRKQIYKIVYKTNLLKKREIEMLHLGARMEAVKRYLNVATHYLLDKQEDWTHMLPVYGKAFHEIDILFDKKL